MGRLRTNINAPILIKEYNNYQDLSKIKLPKCPIYLEIGCGKGDFLIEQAKNNPTNFYLGIEKYSTVILKALKKIQRNQLKLNNLIFTCADAGKLEAKQFKTKISGLYLNFSDPWPKKRHAKRRLTSPNFLNFYRQILKDKAIVEFKTDNNDLYKYTMDVLKQTKNIKILYHTTNLYKNLKNKFNVNNVQTEYEKKFVLLKKPINKIIWTFLK